MAISDEQLSKLLSINQLVSGENLSSAKELAVREQISVYEAILHKDFISDEKLGRLVADFLHLPFIALSALSIPEEILIIIPEIVAKKQKVIAFQKDKEGLHLAMAEPGNEQIRNFIEKKVGIPVILYLATARDINNAFGLYTKDVKKAFDEIIAEGVKEARGAAKAEPPIIKIVDTILTYAYQNKASDIHIEPFEQKSLLRYRVDGILHDIVELPVDLHPRIITRVKVMAKLRTDEHQTAQDGKLQYKTEREELDVRVSILPITEGEKIVMRLLSERSRQFGLSDLGLSEADLTKVKDAYEKPHGMILSTGPTGSGKTTTLYSILKIINKRNVNIMTIEDPVEYDMEGVNQIQVNPKTELTFAKGLRSIVRQDPDIILVGEIRDEETAGIAINSAMTGHLVFSTLHTNDAATSIPRLLDMGIEPFLVTSTVNVIIAQRLVRKIHRKCRTSIEQTEEELMGHLPKELVEKHFSSSQKVRMYKGKGCNVCHDTGYEGRIGSFEVLIIDEEIQKAVVDRKDAATIRNIAIKNGMTTMLEDGLDKVKQGITTIEEIMRVTKE